MFFRKELHWHKLFESLNEACQVVAEGHVTTVSVGNKKICLALTREGFFALSDRCPHNGASLGNGYCTEEGSVVCPMHRYHFDLKTGRARSGLGDTARVYPLEIRENGVYIGFEKTRWNFFS